MRNIHCLNPISKVGLNALPKTYQIITDMNQAEAILVRSAAMHDIKLNRSVLAVARAGAGVNNIPLDDYAKQGVVVFNTPGANANAVKELSIAGMFLASRDIKGGMNWIDENKDTPEISKTVEKVKAQFGGTEIFNKTIGIIGLGAIGIMLAKSCHALGMKVYGTKRNLESLKDENLPQDMILVQTKEELYPHCDFISLNLPLSPETKHMINKEALNQMKDGVIIINFARDALVNDHDLQEAILSKKVKKYVTDFPNDTTARMDGVIAIPHLGASTEEAEENCAFMAANQIVNYIENGDILNSVNFPDLVVGKKNSKSRLTILYDVNINLHDKLHPLLSQKEVLQCLGNKNQKYGYKVVDLKEDITKDFFDSIKKIEGILKVRVV